MHNGHHRPLRKSLIRHINLSHNKIIGDTNVLRGGGGVAQPTVKVQSALTSSIIVACSKSAGPLGPNRLRDTPWLRV